MKCGCVKLRGKNGRLGRTGSSPYSIDYDKMSTKENAVICDGDVIAKVDVAAEPYYGGCGYSVEVNYRCNKCGEVIFCELPHDAAQLTDWLNEWLKNMTPAERDELIRKQRARNRLGNADV